MVIEILLPPPPAGVSRLRINGKDELYMSDLLKSKEVAMEKEKEKGDIIVNTNKMINTNGVPQVPQPFPTPATSAAGKQGMEPQMQVVTAQVQGTAQGSEQLPTPAQTQVPVQAQGTAQVPMATQAAPATQAPAATQSYPYTIVSGSQYFSGGGFYQDITKFQSFTKRKTGFANLDAIHPLLPGLCAVGAIPSLGKTSLVWEIGDQVASQGEYVLYFSLEQSKFELYSKSLSRGFYNTKRANAANNSSNSNYPLYTSMEIRAGHANGVELANQINHYVQSTQDRMRVFEGRFSGTVDDICYAVETFMANTGRQPLVIIDYLQIIEPVKVNGRALDAKSNMDYAVRRLKDFQDSHGLTIIVISSFNRQNYRMPVSYESFKESGGIEYTADMVCGLQLKVMGDIFTRFSDGNGNRIKKPDERELQKILQTAKAESPRQLEMVVLKDRNYESPYNVFFNYESAYDTFLPVDIKGNPII